MGCWSKFTKEKRYTYEILVFIHTFIVFFWGVSISFCFMYNGPKTIVYKIGRDLLMNVCTLRRKDRQVVGYRNTAKKKRFLK